MALAGTATGGPPAAAPDTLVAGFADPPQQARPILWWHWMSGNVSAEGARLDLEWMQRIGIGGVHAFSGGKFPVPQVVSPPKPFMSDGWQDVFRRSLVQARAAGFEFGIAGSPGWSETGGPWVAPADGMKKYVWSETVLRGGKRFEGVLAMPPSVTGPFQAVSDEDSNAQAYGDAAVIAFPTPDAERDGVLPGWRDDAGAIDLLPMSNSPGAPVRIALGATGSTTLTASYDRPALIGGLSMGLREGAEVTVEAAQADGVWRTLVTGSVIGAVDRRVDPAPQRTLSFAPVVATNFRVVLRPLKTANAVVRQFTLSCLQLSRGARVSSFEAKAGFQSTIPDGAVTAPVSKRLAIDPRRVVDLTARLRPDGRLDWSPPAGSWTVLRLGWSLTGAVNAPAEPAATGLEVDKLDSAAVGRYLDAYLGMYKRASGGALGPSGVNALLTDSWEAGVQNWTPRMLAEFHNRRGYDPLTFLPVLAGRVVGSSDLSERFLFDFRRTLKEMVADNHHHVLAERLSALGMRYYSEAQGDFPRAIADGMTLKARADIPTAEYWFRPFATGAGQPPLKADLKEAASAAHVYGKPIAAAEALTVGAVSDPWAFSPGMLKPVADEIFASGINRLLLHESHHQPLVDAKPGLSLFIFGQYFNRNETWAERAGPWITYLSRTAYLLQQGQYIADIAYFYGEERSLSEQLVDRVENAVPPGYGFDYINPEALLTRLSVRDGQLVTPEGMRYKLLFVPDSVRHYTLPMLRRIEALVRDGAVLVASKPIGGLGVLDTDAAVSAIADRIWKIGRVYPTLAAALAARDVLPDVAFEGDGAELLSLHRRTATADIYFLSNQRNGPRDLWATFRVEGRAPDKWNADTGAIEPLTFARDVGHTRVNVKFEPHEAMFVVFRRPAIARAWTAPRRISTNLTEMAGPWEVSFTGLSAPGKVLFPKLISWSESADPATRYFSGDGTYRRDFDVPASWIKPGRNFLLDMGEVREVATVTLNGVAFPTNWHSPFVADIGRALKAGRNRLEIEVINLWPNRLIGDGQPGATPVTYAPGSTYRASSRLLRSGLIGPVRILASDLDESPPP